MKKNKEDGMTDLEIIKQRFDLDTGDFYKCYQNLTIRNYDDFYHFLNPVWEAATRMAAEIERLNTNENFLKTKIADIETQKVKREDHILNLEHIISTLKAALAEKPNVVFRKDCQHRFSEDACALDKETHFCSFGKLKEAKDED